MNNDDPDRIARLADDGLGAEEAAALDARLAALDREIQPPAESWAKVARQLEPHGVRSGRWRSLQVGALAASVAALAVLVTTLTMRPHQAPSPGPVHADLPGDALPMEDRFRTAALPAALGGRDALGEGFIRARADVADDFAARLEELDPATREVVMTNLEVIHAALGRIEAALADDPDNTLLQNLLISSWQQEMDYMGRVISMPRPENRRMEL